MTATPSAPSARHECVAGPAKGYSRYSSIAELILARDVRHEQIAQAAYFRAERRGFGPGHELEDWLAAEGEVDTAATLGMYCG